MCLFFKELHIYFSVSDFYCLKLHCGFCIIFLRQHNCLKKAETKSGNQTWNSQLATIKKVPRSVLVRMGPVSEDICSCRDYLA